MSEYGEMKKSFIRGWNTWNTRSMLSHVLMPEGFAVSLGVKDTRSGRYMKEAFVGLKDRRPEEVFPGAHAYDGSYTELRIKWQDIEFKVETSALGDDLVIYAEPLSALEYPPLLVVECAMLWNREGLVLPEGDAVTANLRERKVPVYVEGTPVSDPYIPTEARYMAVRFDRPVGVSTGKRRSVEEIREIIKGGRERHFKSVEKYGRLAEIYKAMQSCLAWDTVYDPLKDRAISTVSRIWNMNWGGYVLFCWDNYFAAYMASLDSKEIAYSNAIEMTRELTERGFVPNFASAVGASSRDRSQPPVGSMVVRELYRKYGEKWLLEEVFDRLMTWNRWWAENRQVEEGLLAWGSNPYKPVIGHRSESTGVGDRLGAALESGLDNSPMYDDMPFDTESCMMKLADVGLTGMYIMDCEALSDIARILGRKAEAEELKERARRCKRALNKLWDEKSGIFLNRRTDTGEFSRRISPTNFYSLFSSEVSKEQAERMIKEHFYNPEEFWGEWILPSISKNDPAYPGEYWRGRIWAPMNFLTYLALRRHGLKEAARDLAEKSGKLILKEWLERGHVHENYDPETGEGCNIRSSDAFYHWGGLLSLICLMEAGFVEGPENPISG